jgi:hypothetical protein
VRADIHDGQEHKRFMQGPDTDAQDQPLHFLTFGLQRTAGPYSWVIRVGLAQQPVASGLPRTADIAGPTRQVRLLPTAVAVTESLPRN